MTFWESRKLWRQHKDQWFSCVSGERGINWGSTEKFRVVYDNLVYDTIIEDTCHYTFVKTHRIYNIKSRMVK